ncbi:MAG: 4-hydroxythreonine-4-phosphate dehydrogenase PdxA [Gammaproteobacteria bacterium]
MHPVSSVPHRIAITVGEPAGIGPDLILELADQQWDDELVVIGDPNVLQQRAAQLERKLSIRDYNAGAAPRPSTIGELCVLPIDAAKPVCPGRLDPANSEYVLQMLHRACRGCLDNEFHALVTAPVHKGVINDAGIRFSGHTEFFADLCGVARPIMLLASGKLRVALATTHLPLSDVAAHITAPLIDEACRGLHDGLRKLFGLARPQIAVLGLNPHAGESGHLGREELEVIGPALDALRSTGLDLEGPLSADTAFTPGRLDSTDAFLAMYHDQGLPVLKYAGFGNAVNITLGLPIIRTSVDHGTALELAGTGQADSGSLLAAMKQAQQFVNHLHP